MSTKLRACPFCGSDPEVHREGTRGYSCIIGCTNCGAKLESNEYGYGDAWNYRFECNEATTEIYAIENECRLLISAADNESTMTRNTKESESHKAYYQGKKTGLQQAIVACKKALAALQKPAV